MSIAQNLDSVILRIEAARIAYSRHHIVKIVASSKYSDEARIRELYSHGQRAFGENKVQDFAKKASTLADLPLEWHFIGALQSNKINALLAQRPTLLHSLHSKELANAINMRCARENLTLSALLQINSAKEESKNGVMPEEAEELFQEIQESCPQIRLEGVMTIGAHSEDSCVIRRSFEITQRIFENLKKRGARTLSMGMSGDFELAIAHGSNLVRLGSILFR